MVNTYDLIIESNEYKGLLEKAVERITKIKELINNTNYSGLLDITNLCSDKEIIKYKPDGKSVIKGSSILVLYALKGIQISTGIPSDLNDYLSFIKSGFRSEWYKWMRSAKDSWYEKDNICPFCGTHLTEPLKTRVDSLKAIKNKSEYSEYDKEQSFVSDVSSFINDELANKISSINDMDLKADASIVKPLVEGVDFIRGEDEKIKYFLALEAKKLIESKNEGTYGSLSAEFKSKKLSEKLKLCDNSGHNIVNLINEEIENLASDLNVLKECVGKLNKQIKDKISSNRELINNFLEIAGMPYVVDIKQQGDTKFETLFSYKGNPNIITNQQSYLSYGEANALALLLFCLEAKTKENELIILDDPVSSFDNNKRYAIYGYIFNNATGKKLLRGKTCVILTHDFDTVIAFSKCYPLNNQDITCFSYLSLENYELNEKPFSKNDIANTLNIYRSIALDIKRPIISRIVAARHCCEITGEKDSPEYHLLSSLIHKREVPTKDTNGNREFTEEEIALALDKMKNILGNDYDYEVFLKELKNTDNLKSEYKDSKSKFDKLCIARFVASNLKGKSIESNVVWNFLCEVYHIEKDTIHTISNYEIFDVPDYIIGMCDSLISSE